jgi:NAD(P)-dependent dehydrogenase (short-subunit alcohol dehydrogenase family)
MEMSGTAASRVWFITGASRGLGRAFTEAALAAGDRVVGPARDVSPLDSLAAQHPGRLLALRLDVTDRAAVVEAVAQAVRHFGRLDIVVNNAGALLAGMVEEFTEAQARAQLDLNFFGALWVSQAVLAHMRAQGGGHIVQISSVGALGGFPSTGLYSASKWALEGMSEALAAEAARFGQPGRREGSTGACHRTGVPQVNATATSNHSHVPRKNLTAVAQAVRETAAAAASQSAR